VRQASALACEVSVCHSKNEDEFKEKEGGLKSDNRLLSYGQKTIFMLKIVKSPSPRKSSDFDGTHHHFYKKLSCRRETVRRFVLLNFANSLKVTQEHSK